MPRMLKFFSSRSSARRQGQRKLNASVLAAFQNSSNLPPCTVCRPQNLNSPVCDLTTEKQTAGSPVVHLCFERPTEQADKPPEPVYRHSVRTAQRKIPM